RVARRRRGEGADCHVRQPLRPLPNANQDDHSASSLIAAPAVPSNALASSDLAVAWAPMRLLPRRVAITGVEDDGDFDISHWLWTAKEVTTDPIGPYMIAASPRACAAGLAGTTSAPVATCPAREDALDAQPVRTMTAEDEGPALETVVLAFAA